MTVFRVSIITIACLITVPTWSKEITITDHATVIDAQTLSLHQTAIRIWGIAAPVHDEPGATLAATGLFRLFDRHVVTCHVPEDWGRGQPIGKCEAAGLDVGAVMVSSGYARDCPAVSGGHYRLHEERGQNAAAVFLFGYKLPSGCDKVKR